MEDAHLRDLLELVGGRGLEQVEQAEHRVGGIAQTGAEIADEVAMPIMIQFGANGSKRTIQEA